MATFLLYVVLITLIDIKTSPVKIYSFMASEITLLPVYLRTDKYDAYIETENTAN